MVEGTTIKETKYGLSEAHARIIRDIFEKSGKVREGILFGSRAKGNYKPGSDIDLAVKGEEIGREDLAALWSAFEDSPLPFFVDIIDYDSIRNPELKAHIDRVGVRIYASPREDKR